MNNKIRSTLKTLHVFSACLWLGASASVILLLNVCGWSSDIKELAVINKGFTYLDFALIIPGAVGSLITGFLMCKTTGWGFFRYRWVIAKWAATLIGILVGAALLGPWQLQMLQLTSQVETGLPTDTYNTVRMAFAIVGLVQVILLIAIITISVKKPWGKRNLTKDVVQLKKQAEEGLA